VVDNSQKEENKIYNKKDRLSTYVVSSMDTRRKDLKLKSN
jgi:hypothetical protein